MKLVRLLSLEEEVTISLSNPFSENKKVISIKKLTDIFEQETEANHLAEVDEMTLQLKVDQLQQEIKTLQNTKAKVLQDLQTAIEEEKQEWEKQKEQARKEAQEVGYKVGYDAGYEEVFQQHDAL